MRNPQDIVKRPLLEPRERAGPRARDLDQQECDDQAEQPVDDAPAPHQLAAFGGPSGGPTVSGASGDSSAGASPPSAGAASAAGGASGSARASR